MDLDTNLDKENCTSDGSAPSKGNKKTVEETYQKLTQLEHVLLRPDTYIGSTELNRTKVCHQSRNVLSLFTSPSFLSPHQTTNPVHQMQLGSTCYSDIFFFGGRSVRAIQLL